MQNIVNILNCVNCGTASKNCDKDKLDSYWYRMNIKSLVNQLVPFINMIGRIRFSNFVDDKSLTMLCLSRWVYPLSLLNFSNGMFQRRLSSATTKFVNNNAFNNVKTQMFMKFMVILNTRADEFYDVFCYQSRICLSNFFWKSNFFYWYLETDWPTVINTFSQCLAVNGCCRLDTLLWRQMKTGFGFSRNVEI